MDPEVQGAAAAESPAATSPEATSAGTENTGVVGQPEKLTPFNQHPDWQRMVRDRNESRLGQAKAEQRVQELEARFSTLETKSQRGTATPEEEFQLQQAGEALLRVIEGNPKLKGLLALAPKADELLTGYQGVQDLSKGQVQAVARQAGNHIAGLVKAAGLQLDREDLADLTQMVYRRATRIPGAAERFEQGDLEVLSEAFEGVKTKFFGTAARAAATTTLDTKNALRRLPPRTTGGAGGREAAPTLDPNADNKGVQKFTRSLAERARAVINGAG